MWGGQSIGMSSFVVAWTKQLSTFSGSNSRSPSCVLTIKISTGHKSWAQGAEESFILLLFEIIFGGGGSTPQKLSSRREMYEHKWMWLEGGQVHIAIIRGAELSVSLVWLCPRAQCCRGDWCNKCCIAVFESESSW